jgi:hypothetical protein
MITQEEKVKPTTNLGSHTHWNVYDTPVNRYRETRASCGQFVKAHLISSEPTCPTCADWLRRYEEMAF